MNALKTESILKSKETNKQTKNHHNYHHCQENCCRKKSYYYKSKMFGMSGNSGAYSNISGWHHKEKKGVSQNGSVTT